MKTTTLKEIESIVSYNSNKYKDEIEQGISTIKNKGLKRGRVHPRELTETQILNSFKKKDNLN